MYKYSDLNGKVCRSSKNSLFIKIKKAQNQDISEKQNKTKMACNKPFRGRQFCLWWRAPAIEP